MIGRALTGVRSRYGVRQGEPSPRLAAARTFGADRPQWLTEDLLAETADRWNGVPQPAPQPDWTTQGPRWSRDAVPAPPGVRDLFLSTEDSSPTCARAGCGNRPRFWRKTARPVFEGRWACGRACLEALVRSAVHRELAETTSAGTTAPHTHRVPLGLVLLSQGAIDEAQLRASLAAQRETGTGRIGDWLVRQGAVGEAAVTRAMARQWGCPVLREEMLVPESVALAMPPALRDRCRLQPLCVAGRRYLYAGFEDQLDAAGVFALERMSGLTVVPGVLAPAEYRRCAERLAARSPVPCETIEAVGEDAMVAAIQRVLLSQEPAASRLVSLHGHLWLRLWLEPGVVGASGTLPVSSEDMHDYIFG